jgi:hypothetical protein
MDSGLDMYHYACQCKEGETVLLDFQESSTYITIYYGKREYYLYFQSWTGLKEEFDQMKWTYYYTNLKKE